jgi:predicted DNA-binding protein
MTGVLSLRVPSALEQSIRANADRSRMQASQIVRLILEYSLRGNYDFHRLSDTNELRRTKLDIRMPDELVSNLRIHCAHLRVRVSVYVRTILHSYYTKRLVFVEKNDDYTLEENNASKAEAESA